MIVSEEYSTDEIILKYNKNKFYNEQSSHYYKETDNDTGKLHGLLKYKKENNLGLKKKIVNLLLLNLFAVNI